MDSYGNVELTEHYATTKYHYVIYRRDFESIDDELRRYGEYCVKYVLGLKAYLMKTLRSSGRSGSGASAGMVEVYEFLLRCFDENALTRNYLYAIKAKRAATQKYKKLVGGYFRPSWYGHALYYPFVTNIMSDRERAFVNAGKEDYEKREELHFEYLEQLAKADTPFVPRKKKFSVILLIAGFVLAAFGLFLMLGKLLPDAPG